MAQEIEEDNKIVDLILKFMDVGRIDFRVEIAYMITFMLDDKQQKKIKDYRKVREFCRNFLSDEEFIRKLKKRLAVTEVGSIDAVKYWDKIIDKYDEAFNYDKELEQTLLDCNVYLLEFIANVMREVEVSNLEFSFG